MTEIGDELSVHERWDRVFEALAAQPRREVLISLADAPRQRRLALPDAVCDPNSEMDRKTLRAELYHQHLPKLAEEGFVEWERDPLVVQRGPAFSDVEAFLDVLDDSVDRLPDHLAVDCEQSY